MQEAQDASLKDPLLVQVKDGRKVCQGGVSPNAKGPCINPQASVEACGGHMLALYCSRFSSVL